MEITLSKLLSLLAIPAAAVLFAMLGPSKGAAFVGVYCTAPWLLLIWFGDEMGDRIGGTVRGQSITSSTPGWMIVTLGWLLLIGMPCFILMQMRK